MSPVDRDRSRAPSLVVTSYHARISIVTSDRDFKDSNIERQLPVIPAALRSIFIMHLRAPLLLCRVKINASVASHGLVILLIIACSPWRLG